MKNALNDRYKPLSDILHCVNMSFTGLVRIHNIDTYITVTVYNFFLSFSILYPLLVSDQAFISCKTLYLH